jgi:hypothetical protein
MRRGANRQSHAEAQRRGEKKRENFFSLVVLSASLRLCVRPSVTALGTNVAREDELIRAVGR